MKTLIVEDDFTSRLLLQELLRSYGPSHVATNGAEAVEAVAMALEAGDHYDLICLDIMMPQMDGHEALDRIRKCEKSHGKVSSHGAKIVMTTALNDMKNAMNAFSNLCDAYLVKPIDKIKLLATLQELRLLP